MCNETKVLIIKSAHGRSTIINVDRCIYKIVKALNKAGIETVASCCGHGKRNGNIALMDGRELIIAKDYETARIIESINEKSQAKEA